MIEPATQVRAADGAGPGRSCPTRYRYAPSVLARTPDLYADTLLVAGGLYGNAQALERILDLAAAEPGGATARLQR